MRFMINICVFDELYAFLMNYMRFFMNYICLYTYMNIHVYVNSLRTAPGRTAAAAVALDAQEPPPRPLCGRVAEGPWGSVCRK